MNKAVKRSRWKLYNEILKDPERKPVLRMIGEIIYLLFIHKEFPRYYFSRYLYKKGKKNIRNYLPSGLIKKIAPCLNDQKIKEVLDNKLFFDLFYRQFNISLPKILMYNHGRMFVFDNSNIEVNNIKDFTTLLEKIFEQNPLYESIFIKKTYSSSGGKDIYKAFRHQLQSEPESINEIYSAVINSEFLFQETVRQHPVLDSLSPSSLNTIRFDTFTDSVGKADIITAFLKISTNNSFVDNILAGGYIIGIAPETGQLKKSGYTKIKLSGVKVLTEHPITKTKFEGLTIPYFNEAKELVLRAASLMPGLRLVGWDVGISESGPILIEGNSDYGIKDHDLLDGGYIANYKFRKVLKEINYI